MLRSKIFKTFLDRFSAKIALFFPTFCSVNFVWFWLKKPLVFACFCAIWHTKGVN